MLMGNSTIIGAVKYELTDLPYYLRNKFWFLEAKIIAMSYP